MATQFEEVLEDNVVVKLVGLDYDDAVSHRHLKPYDFRTKHSRQRYVVIGTILFGSTLILRPTFMPKNFIGSGSPCCQLDWDAPL